MNTFVEVVNPSERNSDWKTMKNVSKLYDKSLNTQILSLDRESSKVVWKTRENFQNSIVLFQIWLDKNRDFTLKIGLRSKNKTNSSVAVSSLIKKTNKKRGEIRLPGNNLPRAKWTNLFINLQDFFEKNGSFLHSIVFIKICAFSKIKSVSLGSPGFKPRTDFPLATDHVNTVISRNFFARKPSQASSHVYIKKQRATFKTISNSNLSINKTRFNSMNKENKNENDLEEFGKISPFLSIDQYLSKLDVPIVNSIPRYYEDGVRAAVKVRPYSPPLAKFNESSSLKSHN